MLEVVVALNAVLSVVLAFFALRSMRLEIQLMKGLTYLLRKDKK